MKKKKWLSIFLVVCLIGGIGGGIWYRQKRIDERRLSLVYIPKVVDKTNDFWKALILGTRMAAQEYNATIEIKAPTEENDVERQNELLKEAIEEGPDAILISPSSFTESNKILDEAKEKGIKISFIDSYTPYFPFFSIKSCLHHSRGGYYEIISFFSSAILPY